MSHSLRDKALFADLCKLIAMENSWCPWYAWYAFIFDTKKISKNRFEFYETIIRSFYDFLPKSSFHFSIIFQDEFRCRQENKESQFLSKNVSF